MAKNNNKINAKMDELVAIEKSPELTEFIIRNKIKDVRKSAVIICIIMSFASLIAGVVIGMNMDTVNHNGNNSTVDIRVNVPENATVENNESGK